MKLRHLAISGLLSILVLLQKPVGVTEITAQPHSDYTTVLTSPPSRKLPVTPFPSDKRFVEGEVLLKYKEDKIRDSSLAKRKKKIVDQEINLQSKYKVKGLRTFPTLGIQHLKLRAGQSVTKGIEELKKEPAIEFVEPNYEIFPLYSSPPGDKQWVSGYLWGMNSIGMKQAWSTPLSDLADNVVVAILDSGVAHQHPDLQPQMWRNAKEASGLLQEDDDGNDIIDDIYGAGFCWNYPSGQGVAFGNVFDGSYPHGTIVAGIIGAAVNNSAVGGSEMGYVAGVQPKVKLMAMKILCGPNNAGTVSDAIEAIRYAWKHNANIINASWAITSGSEAIGHDTSAPAGSLALKLAIEEAGTHKVLFVTAAGNNSAAASDSSRDNGITPVYPANYGAPGPNGLDNVIAVAATSVCALSIPPQNGICADGTSINEGLSPESHFGFTTVHIAAPGKDIVSTGWEWTTNAPSILVGDGTSFATAHVSGCAALLQAKNLKKKPSVPLLPKELKERLMNSGDSLGSLTGKVISGRRINCSKALQAFDSTPPAPPTGLGVR
jgi:hypothetical protein